MQGMRAQHRCRYEGTKQRQGMRVQHRSRVRGYNTDAGYGATDRKYSSMTLLGGKNVASDDCIDKLPNIHLVVEGEALFNQLTCGGVSMT